ncbi:MULTISPECIES: HAD-IIB family hydrolase [unclassified Lysinibacillus]|uniref:HAD-IIB family hydrolase n=1 Tax=unclassified Lysinibacillus TaxID=2636778 RepID=UPI0037F52AF0
MSGKKILAFDLDNTLIDNDGEFYKGIKEVLLELKTNNFELFLVTGRIKFSLFSLPIFNDIREIFNENILSNDGNLHIIHEKDELINQIDPLYLNRFISVHNDNYDWIIETNNNLFYTELSSTLILSNFSFIDQSYFMYTTDIKSIINEIKGILNIYAFPKEILTLDEWKNSFYKIYYPFEKQTLFEKFIKISPKYTDKYNGLNSVLKKNNLLVKDLISFGNGNNDISLIKNSSVGVAVKNSHPKLIEYSDVHLNEDLSVFLKEYLVNKLEVRK